MTKRLGRRVFFTVDVEPDCPPFLWTWRGIERGMPALLDLLADRGVCATCFVTGDTARRYPDLVARIASSGHEVGCHGFSHESFATFDARRAAAEIRDTNALLRQHASVSSFRAPFLRFPERFLPLLAADGIALDASRARYKRQEPANRDVASVRRLPASATSSVLRLPRLVRDPWIAALGDPLVLFVHPWEFVDLTRSGIRYDCRFRTGRAALDAVASLLDALKREGARFVLARDYRADAPSISR